MVLYSRVSEAADELSFAIITSSASAGASIE